MGRILVFTYSHHPCGWTTWCWECEPWPTGKETQMPFSQCQWKPAAAFASITFSNLCGYFWVIGEHYPFTSSVTPLKQGITLHKALAIFFHFPCDTLWIPTKHHEKKQTKRQGVLESNMPAPAGILFFITYMAWDSHSLLELWSYMQAPLGGGLKVIWIITSPCLLWRGRHCCQCLPPWTWVSSLSSGDSSAFPYTKWPAVCRA